MQLLQQRAKEAWILQKPEIYMHDRAVLDDIASEATGIMKCTEWAKKNTTLMVSTNSSPRDTSFRQLHL